MNHHPRRRRRGRISLLWTLLLGTGVAVVVLVWLLHLGGPDEGPAASQLSVYCAAGLRHPVEQIAQQYEQEYGVHIDLQFGGSNTLLNQMEVNKFDTGDLFLAAEDLYAKLAQEKGLAAETLPVAHQRPVIAVPKSSAKKIASINDLFAEGVTVALANPDQAAIGLTTKKLLSAVPQGKSTLWDTLEQHVTKHGVFKPTVTEVANDLKLGSVDAGIVWDATVAMPSYRDALRAVPVAELAGEPSMVTVCVLNSSRQPTAALRFARYLTARDRGLPVFRKFGLRPVEGDVWVERPELTFFCGAVNRRAVEQILADFQAREGVTINTSYNGCGILTSQMQTIEGQRPEHGFPDVYMACDVYYLENVKQWFQEAANVSDAEIVIAVPKGSTKVKRLADLIEPGVRVAVGEPSQCTIGALTRRLLVKEGLYDTLKEKQKQPGEVVVEKSSSAHLVPDAVTGHVDAAIAYITDVQANRDTIDVVRIESELNLAIQPFSISKTSDHKYLGRRLFQKIARSAEAFENAGFHFRLKEEQDAAPAAKPVASEAERS